MKFLILVICSSLFFYVQGQAQEIISLGGEWHVKLDSLDIGIKEKWYNQKFESLIQLPGTLDDAGIGTKNNLSAEKLKKEVLLNLTRKRSYIGAAWYTKEVIIPQNWHGKNVCLYWSG